MYQSIIHRGKKRTDRNKKKDIVFAEDGQEYAVVKELLGNGRLRCMCTDGKLRMGRIRGSLRNFSRKVIIEKGDLILISGRDFEEDKVDVLHKYNHEEVMKLMEYNTIPESIVNYFNFSDSNDIDDNVIFTNKEEDQIIEAI